MTITIASAPDNPGSPAQSEGRGAPRVEPTPLYRTAGHGRRKARARMRTPGFLRGWRPSEGQRLAALALAVAVVAASAVFVALKSSPGPAPGSAHGIEALPSAGGTDAAPPATVPGASPVAFVHDANPSFSNPDTRVRRTGRVAHPPVVGVPATGSALWTTCWTDAWGYRVCAEHETFRCATDPSSGDTSCTFRCTTDPVTGETTCKGSSEDFTCSTDPTTGGRSCSNATSSWSCVAVDGATRSCNGRGSYSCVDGDGSASESCRGPTVSRTFSCYDDDAGRHCSRASTTDPDCFVESIFGVYCRDV